MVKQAKITWRLQTPVGKPRMSLKTPESEVAEDSPVEGFN